MDRRWIAALSVVGVGALLFVTGAVILDQYDPGRDRLQPAYSIGNLLVVAGMLLVLLSAIPVRHLRWLLIPYLVAAAAGWFAAIVVGYVIVQLAAEIAALTP